MASIEYWMEHKEEMRSKWEQLTQAERDELRRRMGQAALHALGIW